MSGRPPLNGGMSLGQLLAVPLAVLIALGGSLVGTTAQCHGDASPQNSSVVTTAPHHSPENTLSGAFSDASASRVSAVTGAVSLIQKAAPSEPRCGPLSTWPSGITSATVRPIRLLDHLIQPQEISVRQDGSMAGAPPYVLWASSATAHPPQGHFSDSPPAQEFMGTLRSVVLRL